MVINDEIVRNVPDITSLEKRRIMDFLQGAVYCWCNNTPNEWFRARDFLGGLNSDWKGTPLQILYNNNLSKYGNSEEAKTQAGIEAGWLLKEVLVSDVRTYESQDDYKCKEYRIIL